MPRAAAVFVYLPRRSLVNVPISTSPSAHSKGPLCGHSGVCSYNSSTSRIHPAAQASLGIRQSPLGETATLPTFGPSGRQERLNCCMKNLR